MAPKEKISVFYCTLGYLCSAQVGFAAQEAHSYVLLQLSSKQEAQTPRSGEQKLLGGRSVPGAVPHPAVPL